LKSYAFATRGEREINLKGATSLGGENATRAFGNATLKVRSFVVILLAGDAAFRLQSDDKLRAGELMGQHAASADRSPRASRD
jgi:hypothetical protein